MGSGITDSKLYTVIFSNLFWGESGEVLGYTHYCTIIAFLGGGNLKDNDFFLNFLTGKM